MTLTKYILISLFVCTLLSCTDQKDGDWEDQIKLSQKEFVFDSSPNTAYITTEGDSWWISEIFFKNGEGFHIDDVDTSAKNFEINTSDFTLKRINGTEMTIDVFENNTHEERTLTIGLQSGNYFDGISVTQKAE